MLASTTAPADVFDFTRLSRKNHDLARRSIRVASGATFVVLDLPEHEARKAENVLYLHVHAASRRCYVGITVQAAAARWNGGVAYRKQPYFGNAIKKHGWSAFRSYILAFFDNREDANQAERDAIAAAGGHKSKWNFNTSPGGDEIADNEKPLVGVNLKTKAERVFKSGVDAARQLRLGDSDGPTAVARGERLSVGGWWFRFQDDVGKQPPSAWGEAHRKKRSLDAQAKRVLALNLATREERSFPSAASAATALGCHHSAVIAVALGRIESSHGWWFKYEEDSRKPPELWGASLARQKRDRQVFGTNLSTGERRTFRNCTAASAALDFPNGVVASVASGARASTGGWWFSYSREAEPPKLFAGSLVAQIRSKAVVATNVATGELRRYDSAKIASADLRIHRSTICVAIKKNRVTSGWRFTFASADAALDPL